MPTLNNEDKYSSNSIEKSSNENNDQFSKILCIHCKRTKTNGIRCLGICISDNDY